MKVPLSIVLIVTAMLACACAKRYPLKGMVLQVRERAVVVSHEAIPGLMDAMAMDFAVRRQQELRGLHPGTQIESRLVVRKQGSYLEKIRALPGAADGLVQDQGDRIVLPVSPEKVALGTVVPDFSLTDQTGAAVRFSGLRGRVVAVNFIYTRCPLPDVCPRLSANFAALQRRFSSRQDLMLLSVTIDPEHDTPAVLLQYAKTWSARAEAWRFLTGSSGEVQSVASRFGMNYWPEQGLITHTSMTGVVARDGKLVAVVQGSIYRAQQLGDLIEKELGKQP